MEGVPNPDVRLGHWRVRPRKISHCSVLRRVEDFRGEQSPRIRIVWLFEGATRLGGSSVACFGVDHSASGVLRPANLA